MLWIPKYCSSYIWSPSTGLARKTPGFDSSKRKKIWRANNQFHKGIYKAKFSTLLLTWAAPTRDGSDTDFSLLNVRHSDPTSTTLQRVEGNVFTNEFRWIAIDIDNKNVPLQPEFSYKNTLL